MDRCEAKKYLREREKEPPWIRHDEKKWIIKDGKFPVIRYGSTCYVYGIPPCLALLWVRSWNGPTGLFNNLYIAQEVAEYVYTVLLRHAVGMNELMKGESYGKETYQAITQS